jgi:hypothetical protein
VEIRFFGFILETDYFCAFYYFDIGNFT